MKRVSNFRVSAGFAAAVLAVFALPGVVCRGAVPFDPVLDDAQLWSLPASTIVDIADGECFDVIEPRG